MSPCSRTYERTHPWLTFSIDLNPALPKFWMLLGEARSKIEHIAGSPLKPSVAEQMHLLYLAKGIQATTAIEGNTLTEEQARQLIKGELTLPESQQYLAQEIENILEACNGIFKELQSKPDTDLTIETIKKFNHQVLKNLSLGEGVTPGEVRTHSVVVGKYLGAPAEDCSYLLERMCSWLNADFSPPSPEMRVPYAILRALIAHLYFAWIHPFGDGNGRTARLIELQILLAAGVPTPAAHLLSNHYNLTRSEYYRQLARTSQTMDILPFLEYAVIGFVDGLREQLSVIKSQQFDDRWEQFVYETFGNHHTAAHLRRRQLVLDLSKARRPVPKSGLSKLSPEVAAQYGGKEIKTLTRDINELVRLDLIRQTSAGFLPRKERIRAFLPPSMHDVLPD